MSTEQNQAIVRRYFEDVWNSGDLQVADEIIEADFTFKGPVRSLEGIEAFKQYVSGIHATFPDIHFELEGLIGENDSVVVRWTMTGTHNKEFMGIPPSGNAFTVQGMTIMRISGGKAVEAQLYWDRLSLLEQLGAKIVPA